MNIVILVVFRDANGSVINIGPWDYQEQYDFDLEEMVVTNPLPEGATWADEEVELMPDGSRRVVNP